MMKLKQVFLRVLLTSSIVALAANIALSQTTTPETVGTWTRVSGFSISEDETYIILSVKILGKNQLYESSFDGDRWSELKPIEAINKHYGEGFDIDGPALSYNKQILFFHADFPDSEGGTDIYYSTLTADGWSAPISIGKPINTNEHEMYPSASPGLDRIIFSRYNDNPDFKKPKESPTCHKLYMASSISKGQWENPVAVHHKVNRGCEHSPRLAIDGKTILFSSVDATDYKQGYNVYFTREIIDDNWLDAVLIPEIASDEQNTNPQIAGEHLYFLKTTIDRKEELKQIFRVKTPAQAKHAETINSKGVIVDLESQQPIDATLTVFNPTTLKELGYFESDKQTGEFLLPLINHKNYIVDVRKHGYSFASFMVDFRNETEIKAPSRIELFKEVELNVSVFDSENFRPLNADISIYRLDNESNSYITERLNEGVNAASLPLGYEYKVAAQNIGFESNELSIDLRGDVVFSHFERSLSLLPIKKEVEIEVSDSETNEGVAAEIIITNLNREEVIIFKADDVKNGKVKAVLREGDKYEFTVRGAQGYSFHNQVVDLNEEDTGTIKAELVSLKAETSIRLNNINFSSNSADLSSEAFPELNRVIQLIFDNPAIVIEISAHTDNVGSARFNKVLSERRAQSVVAYLLENGVPQDRIVAKGYGLSNPMVPNNSDENRALNRRVEFKIIDIKEESSNENSFESE